MGTFDQCDYELFDGDDDYEDDNVTCKRCGKTGLWWFHSGVRWRLMDDKNPHQCAIVANVDAFKAFD